MHDWFKSYGNISGFVKRLRHVPCAANLFFLIFVYFLRSLFSSIFSGFCLFHLFFVLTAQVRCRCNNFLVLLTLCSTALHDNPLHCKFKLFEGD